MTELDKTQIRRNFSRFAAFDNTPTTMVSERLWERVCDMSLSPSLVLDIGGDGLFLQKWYPDARVIAVDFSLPSLRKANTTCVLADAEQLPFPDHCADVFWSNLCLEWTNVPQFFKEAQRVLKPNGLLAITTLGPDTLKEMRYVFAGENRVHDFTDMHNTGDLVLSSGFVEPILESEYITFTYSSEKAAIMDCRNLGAGCARMDRQRGMMSKAAWQTALKNYPKTQVDGKDTIMSTFEIVYLTAWRIEKETISPINFYKK